MLKTQDFIISTVEKLKSKKQKVAKAGWVRSHVSIPSTTLG
jgi:hypothetical protein